MQKKLWWHPLLTQVILWELLAFFNQVVNEREPLLYTYREFTKTKIQCIIIGISHSKGQATLRYFEWAMFMK